jgi:hypothetical protein
MIQFIGGREIRGYGICVRKFTSFLLVKFRRKLVKGKIYLFSFNALFSLLHYFDYINCASTPLPPWYQSRESCGLLLPLESCSLLFDYLICSPCDLSICPFTLDLSVYFLTLDLSFLCSVFR